MTVESHTPAGRGGATGDVRAKLMLVALCLLWGVTWPAMKIALIEIPPLSMHTLTAAAGGLTLLAFCLATRTRLRIPAKRLGVTSSPSRA